MAIRLAEEAVTRDPGYACAFAVRARVHFDAGEYAAAVTDQERAIALLPEQVDDRPLVAILDEYRRVRTSAAAAENERR